MVKVGPYVITAGTDAAGYEVSVLKLSNGKPVWHKYTLGQAAKVLAVDTSRVYAPCGRLHVCAYDINTGAREWGRAELDAPPALAAEADGVLYLDLGTALNAATGKIITTIWGSAIFAAQPATALAVGNGRIAVVADPRVLDLYGLPGY